MLAYVIDNFDETIEFNDVYEIVNYVRDIDMTYIDKYGFDEETGNILREMCEITKECVSTPDLYDSMFAGQYSFKNSVNILYKAKLIEDFDRDILMSIYGQIVKAYNQETSNDEVVGNIKSQAELGQKRLILWWPMPYTALLCPLSVSGKKTEKDTCQLIQKLLYVICLPR